LTKLELLEVDKSYGKKHVLDKVSLKVEKGEFFVILGPSGEGKSTLLRILAGIEQPDSGKVMIDGRDETANPPNKRNIAMVFQNYALYPNMTVRGNVSFPLKMRHVPKPEIRRKVAEATKMLRIDDIVERPVTRISGGQKQRVALARAMVRDPALFLLDEPLSNLDARTRFVARGELKRVQQELGQTFIYVTHDQKEAASLGTSVGVLHAGKFEQVGPFEQMYEKPSTKWVGQFLGEFPMNFLPGPAVGQPEGVEVGFYPEWVKVGAKGIDCTVESMETVGDTHYLFCALGGDAKAIIKSPKRFGVGEKASFGVERFNVYKDGLLAGQDGKAG
jgi:trehalose transport system ATP-binding protein